jgi:hypothetical protein
VIRPRRRCCRLQAAEAAQDWMAGQHHRTPSARPGAICHHRVVRPRRRHPRRVPPGLGLSRRGDRDDLPSLRSDDADRLVGRDRPVTWRWPSSTWWPRAPGLLTGSRPPPSRAGGSSLRWTNGRGCRMPSRRCCARRADAEGAHRETRHRTATALLRELQSNGTVREVTGREFLRVRDLIRTEIQTGDGTLDPRLDASFSSIRPHIV